MTLRVPERVLTQRELNRAVLARQLLLERENLPVPRALERVGGLQTQESRSGYIGLWSRLQRFEREDLTRALSGASAVQGTVMRITIHTVSARDYRLFTEGIRAARRESWVKSHGKRGRRQEDARGVEAGCFRCLPSGPSWRREVVEELGLDSPTWNGVGMWVDLLRAPPSGTWDRPRADLYVTADDVARAGRSHREKGLEHLLRRYLGAFGPATLKDAANWAGLPAKALRRRLRTMTLRRFRFEDGMELLDLRALRFPIPRRPPRLASCPRGTRRCSPTRGGRDPPRASIGRGLRPEDASLAQRVPRRRAGGRLVEARAGSGEARAVRPHPEGRSETAGRGGRAARGVRGRLGR